MTTTVQYAVSLDDGSVAVLTIVLDDGRTIKRALSDALVFQEISRSFATGPLPVRYRKIEENEVPADRSYRNAWTDNNGVIVHDMGKARAIHMETIRFKRNLKLDGLDKAWLQAQTSKRDATAIETEMQTLRDFPQTIQAAIDACLTIEELKAIQLPE